MDDYGDDKFKDYMNREYSSKTDPIIIIIDALRCKISAISDIYGKSLDAYKALLTDDPLKKVLEEHIKSMMDQTLQTMNQFNYALISDGDGDGVDDEDEETQKDEGDSNG